MSPRIKRWQAILDELAPPASKPMMATPFIVLATEEMGSQMRIILLMAGLFFLPVSSALSQQAAPSAMPDPPFDVYLHTLSENGRSQLVVMYHADHTYTMTSRSSAGKTYGSTASAVTMERDKYAGRWWIEGSKFCWTQELGPNPRNHCKKNGHYIGRMPIPGWESPVPAH